MVKTVEIGASISATYSCGDFSFSAGVGIMSNSNYNGFGKNGLEIRKSILAAYDDGKTGVEHWTKLYGSDYFGEGGYRDAMEYDAYSYQYRMGDSSFYVNEGVDKYYNRMVMKWNKARN